MGVGLDGAAGGSTSPMAAVLAESVTRSCSQALIATPMATRVPSTRARLPCKPSGSIASGIGWLPAESQNLEVAGAVATPERGRGVRAQQTARAGGEPQVVGALR